MNQLFGLQHRGDRHLGMGACFHGIFFAIFLMVFGYLVVTGILASFQAMMPPFRFTSL